ncbi:MAG: triacylglycerol lipase [Ruminococcaceae bacterium]|nr:triacylglycerol lipase [Oscillospiraceae bacterium]
MKKRNLLLAIFAAAFCICGNFYYFWSDNLLLLIPVLGVFIVANVVTGVCYGNTGGRQLKICAHGTALLKCFCLYLPTSLAVHIALAFIYLPEAWLKLIFSMVACIVAGAVVFWNGMISVYVSSIQLGIRERVLGAVCGMIPVVNLIMLGRIIKITEKEILFESEKNALNRSRIKDKICATKYPILLVHGVFFRDSNVLNYWGRVPAELQKNGAVIYYGDQQSALSIKDSAEELSRKIRDIVEKNGCGKVNIIAHSKGGLDARYAIQNCGISEYVASLTTVNTPHRGCKFADYLLEKAPQSLLDSVADKYNKIFRFIGDKAPDFVSAAKDLTTKACEEFNKNVNDTKGIYCQSVGSVQKKASSGRFPLNITYHAVNLFDSENDGLVGEDSFSWGDRYILNKPKGSRGISHGDMIDLNRENIDGFDVREFYVLLVADLKNRGL